MAIPIPRPEYPRPQFARADWLCLNGEWQFETDPGDSGLERGLLERELSGRILVPFCPESTLSGIHQLDFMRFEGLCNALLDNPAMFGYCYTQLTDVYQEQNGIYTFDRRAKFDLERLRRIQGRPAAVERSMT